MGSEPPSEPFLFLVSAFVFFIDSSTIFSTISLIFLVISSALISGSEVAFFSLKPTDFAELEEEPTASAKRLLTLKEKPRTVLATILITNNFVNIAIVVVSSLLINNLLPADQLTAIGQYLFDHGFAWMADAVQLGSIFNFLITVVGVTFLLVLFGEIAPKIYANLNNLWFARFMSGPLTALNTFFGPFSRILVSWSNRLENRIVNSANYQSSTSKEDIDAAIDLTMSTHAESEEEADILKGIVKFGDIITKQIMKSRVDVTAIDIEANFKEVIDIIKESGYSRIPVYKEDFDNIEGVLYVKDLLGLSDQKQNFDWQKLIRNQVLYVPETKNIDDLLKEFQLKRTHIAIVVDEYGGSSGLVTLEDVMEEVIGDIKDEFDEGEDVEYVQLSEGNYIFEGKSLLNDVCRIIGVDTNYFDESKGESDSLAGFILETTGVFPKVEQEFEFRDVKFKIVSMSRKRIEKVNVKL